MGHKYSDVRFANVVKAGLAGTRLHVKVGTHPASYANMIGRNRPPKVGDFLFLENEVEGGKPLRVRCDQIKDLGHGDILYYVELM